MALFGTLTTLQEQAPPTNGFAIAFAYVEQLLREGSPEQTRVRALAAGEAKKIELGGGVFVIEQVYETKARADGFFESHRSYIDVQVVLAGEELMEVIDVSRIQVRDAYQPERDLIVYADHAAASVLRMLPGLAAIFFPADVHMPSLRATAAPMLVRKAVVKVPVLAE